MSRVGVVFVVVILQILDLDELFFTLLFEKCDLRIPFFQVKIVVSFVNCDVTVEYLPCLFRNIVEKIAVVRN